MYWLQYIRFIIKCLGKCLKLRYHYRPSATAKVDKKQEYQDNTDRIEVERTFSLSKRCYGMSCITTKLEETQLTSIALSVFVTNLFRIQRRILCALLHLFRFWHDRNRCKSWKLQIAA
ncbi:transposase [Mediterraneibacter gnavus]|uniref:transposase n=1 Tax=Mediterraneibacter gnavus TaxID=33038 RepID=UPI0036D2F8FD